MSFSFILRHYDTLKKVLFNNKEIPTAMPGLGINIGGEMYMTGKEDRMFGKTKIAVAKVTAGN